MPRPGRLSAARFFGERYPDADAFRVTLYRSLTFYGRRTRHEKAILASLPNAEIIFHREERNLPHPNTMLFPALKNGEEIGLAVGPQNSIR